MNTMTEATAANPRSTRPVTRWLYAALSLFLGISALFGGGSLLLDPTGQAMGMPLEWLDGTPFSSYLLPGFILFTVLGLGAFVALAGVLLRTEWAWGIALGLGVALVAWIIVQILFIQRLHVLQGLYGGLGLALVVLALTPSFRAAIRR